MHMKIPSEIEHKIRSYLYQCNNCNRLCIFKLTSLCHLCKKFWCLKCNTCVINKHIKTYVPCCYTCRIQCDNANKNKIPPWLSNYNNYN